MAWFSAAATVAANIDGRASSAADTAAVAALALVGAVLGDWH
jgi:hypothetical protein